MKRSYSPEKELTNGKWIDTIIPNGSVIATIEVMYIKPAYLASGFKFLSSDGKVLLSCGMIDDQHWRDNS